MLRMNVKKDVSMLSRDTLFIRLIIKAMQDLRTDVHVFWPNDRFPEADYRLAQGDPVGKEASYWYYEPKQYATVFVVKTTTFVKHLSRLPKNDDKGFFNFDIF